MPAPLDGVRILDLTRYQNGAHATSMLSDMGADVLKIELPGEGDHGRSLGRLPDGFSAYFEGHNRGKRSMTLDLRLPEGQEVIRRLAAQSDVLTENFRPGLLDSLGLGYEDIKAVNSKIIYASNTGFGPKGDWSTRGSFDVVAQGMSGAMIGVGGGPGNVPVAMPWGLADQVGSMIFAYGIVAAVLAKERWGVGQRVDVSQLGAMLTLQAAPLTGFLHTGVQPSTPPGRRYTHPSFGAYPAGDGKWFTVGALDPKFWAGFCRAIDRVDLIKDPRCAQAAARVENADWLRVELAAEFAKWPRAEVLERFIAQKIACGPVYDYAELTEDPQFWVNGYLVEVEHPHFEGHRAVGIPLTMSETPLRVQGPAPELGQHTEEVLLSLGYDWADIERMHDQGVTTPRSEQIE